MALASSEGVVSADVNFANHTAQVVTKGSSEALIKAVAGTGYQASLILDAEKVRKSEVKENLLSTAINVRRQRLGLGLGIPLMLYGVMGGNMMVSSLTDRVVWLLVGLLTLWIMIQAGKHYFRGAWKAFSTHQANMDMLIALGTGSAWFYSMLVVLMPNWFPQNTKSLIF